MTNFCSLVSGSSGNCCLFTEGDTKILIDCGISGKKTTAYLNDMGIDPFDIDGIFVTHEHIDHSSGVGVFSRKYNVPVLASEGTWRSIDIGKISDVNKVVFKKNEPITCKNVVIMPFDIPHDASQPTGFVIQSKTGKYAVATDMGCITKDVLDNISGCNAVILESNYDEHMLKTGSYPPSLKTRIVGNKGHLDNKDSAKLATLLAKSGTKRILLGHLSNENNSPEIAFAEVAKELEFNGFTPGKNIHLSVAPRYEKSENICSCI